MTEDFYVTTKLATIESSVPRDRAGCAKVGVHDSVVLCCVAIEEAKLALQALGSHDRGTCSIWEFYSDREFSVVTYLDRERA